MSNSDSINQIINKIRKPAEIVNQYARIRENITPVAPSIAVAAQRQAFANTTTEIIQSSIQFKHNFIDYQSTFSNIIAISQIFNTANTFSVVNSPIHALTESVSGIVKPLPLGEAFLKSLDASVAIRNSLEKDISFDSLLSSIDDIQYTENYIDFPEPLATVIEQYLDTDEAIYQSGVPSTRFKRMSAEKVITYCKYIISIITFIMTICGMANDVSSSITEKKHHEEQMKEERKQTKELEKSNKLQQEYNDIQRKLLKDKYK